MLATSLNKVVSNESGLLCLDFEFLCQSLGLIRIADGGRPAQAQGGVEHLFEEASPQSPDGEAQETP